MTKFSSKFKKTKKFSNWKNYFLTIITHSFGLFQKVVFRMRCFLAFKNRVSLIIKQLQGYKIYMGYFVDGGHRITKKIKNLSLA